MSFFLNRINFELEGGTVNQILLLLGRVSLVLFFVVPAALQTMNLPQAQLAFAKRGVPYPNLILVVSLAVRYLGCLLVTFGFKVQLGVVLLLLYLIPAAIFFTWPTSLGSSYPFLQNIAVFGE